MRCGQLKDALGVLKEWLISQEISLDPSAPLPIDLDSLAHSIQHNKVMSYDFIICMNVILRILRQIFVHC